MRARTATTHRRDTPDFDPIARLYRWMEYLTFGPMLERCRFHFLPQCAHARHALVLGDGDGRFTARFLAVNPNVEIDAVDSSAAMLAELERRAQAQSNVSRLRTIHADLRDFVPVYSEYDLVVAHFFFDCLTDGEVAALIERTMPHLTSNATWLISEFAIPEKGWRCISGRLLIRFLYFAFEKMTRLHVRQIPDYPRILTERGFRRQQQTGLLGGLLVTEIWREET